MKAIRERSRQCWITVLVMCIGLRAYGQVSITTGSYTQDFGTTDVTSWTNNVTYPGWYRSSATFAGHVNMTAAAPTNTGGFYTYECNGNNDQKIGSRASSGTGLSNIRYGVVLRNQTGSTINSLRVAYTGYQLSLAQNGGVVNTLAFDFVTSASLPSITATATASVATLNFDQVTSSGMAGSAQIEGYPCTRSLAISGCVALATPLANNSYILLRWTDVDDSNNDHHMAIDDVKIDFDLTGATCTTFLPIELLYFSAEPENDNVQLDWATASEQDNDHFIVHRGATPFDLHPILQQAGAGTSQRTILYEDLDRSPLPGLSYYQLQQVDIDGSTSWSDIVAVQRKADEARFTVYPNPSPDGRFFLGTGDEPWLLFEVYEAGGRLIQRTSGSGPLNELDLSGHPAGTYVVRCITERSSRSALIQKAAVP